MTHANDNDSTGIALKSKYFTPSFSIFFIKTRVTKAANL